MDEGVGTHCVTADLLVLILLHLLSQHLVCCVFSNDGSHVVSWRWELSRGLEGPGEGMGMVEDTCGLALNNARRMYVYEWTAKKKED